MPRSTIGMSKVLWMQTKKLDNILLPWPSISMNLVTEQKHVKWNSGTSWVMQHNCLKWSREWPIVNRKWRMSLTGSCKGCLTSLIGKFINSGRGSRCSRVPCRQVKILVPKHMKSRRPWWNGLIRWKDISQQYVLP